MILAMRVVGGDSCGWYDYVWVSYLQYHTCGNTVRVEHIHDTLSPKRHCYSHLNNHRKDGNQDDDDEDDDNDNYDDDDNDDNDDGDGNDDDDDDDDDDDNDVKRWT